MGLTTFARQLSAAFFKRPKLVIGLIFFFSLLLIIIHYQLTGFSIYSDGIGYYVYDRSIVIDHDLNFSNEYAYYENSYSRISNMSRGDIFRSMGVTKTGLVQNFYSIGVAILQLPFFLAAHLVTLLLAGLGVPLAADGYSILYELFVAIGMLLYAFIGSLAVFKFLSRFYSQDTSLLATLTLVLSTGLIWYMAVEPTMSHGAAFFIIALFVCLWYSTLENRSIAQWVLLGLIGGLAVLIRQVDGIFLLLIAFEAIPKLFSYYKARQWDKIRGYIFGLLAFAAAVFIIFVPQFLAWKEIYGSYLYYSYGKAGTVAINGLNKGVGYWTGSSIVPMLFSLKDGLIRMPVIIISILCLLFIPNKMKDNKVRYYFAALCISEILVYSFWSLWNSGYNSRFLISSFPLLSVGLASGYEAIRKKSGWLLLLSIVSLIALNLLNVLSMLRVGV